MASNNVGRSDAALRWVVALLLLLLSASLQDRPLVALAVGFLGVSVLSTALFRICPLYTLFGISTCRRSQA
jgi:hypothetical protein